MLDYRAHTFLVAYQLRCYTAAARELHISQPAVSQHIKHLEAQLGRALFVAHGRTIEPTPAGNLLYRRLSVMANDEARMRSEVARTGLQSDEPLRLGCTRTIADYAAPQLLAAHALAHPGEPLVMRTNNTQALVQGLERGELDIALVEGSFDRTQFAYATYSHEPFIVVGAPGSTRPGHLRDLLDRTFIVREPGSGTREIMERSLMAHGLDLTDAARVFELDSIPVIKACVAAGAGISFMYRVAVEDDLARGALVDITPSDAVVEHDFCLIWQRGSQYAARYQALLDEWSALSERSD